MKLKTNHVIAGLAVGLSFGVAGCGPVALAEIEGTAAVAIDGDKGLSSKVGGVESDFAANTSATAKNTFTIFGNDNGAVDMVVKGETASFAATDADGEYGWHKKDGTKEGWLYSWNGKTAAVLDPNSPDYSQIWEYYLYDDATKKEAAGFSVTGTHTNHETLKSRPTATFEGYMVARTWGKMDPHNQSQLEAGTDNAKGIYGEGNTGVTLTADFAGGTVEGEIKGITAAWNGGGGPVGPAAAIAGSMKMDKANIDGIGFYQGTITNDGMPMDLGTATYVGDFYGPEAEETAGLITLDTPTQVGSGAFRAFKQ